MNADNTDLADFHGYNLRNPRASVLSALICVLFSEIYAREFSFLKIKTVLSTSNIKPT